MIAIIIPTIREDCFKEFVSKWSDLIDKHGATLISVHDGENPYVQKGEKKYSVNDIMGKKYADLIYNLNDGVRNLGFAFVAKFMPKVEVVCSFDDDTLPYEDTIGDHLEVLSKRVPVSWLSTADEYMRGFPYGIRDEAEVVLSHGVWEGIYDYDAPTQLVKGNVDTFFYRGPIPKGIFYPMCGMNIAFKRKLLPYMYFAPMGHKVGLDRFADIWAGIESKRVIDEKGWAVVQGYSTVYHNKASNVFTNLVKEAKGLGLNEKFWKDEETDPYFKLYAKQRKRWEEFIND